MKGLIITSVLLIIALIAFIGGALAAAPGLMMSAFCTSPVLFFALGWAAGRVHWQSPIRSDSAPAQARPQQQRYANGGARVSRPQDQPL